MEGNQEDFKNLGSKKKKGLVVVTKVIGVRGFMSPLYLKISPFTVNQAVI